MIMNEDLKRWDTNAEKWTKEVEPKRLFRPILIQNALDQLLEGNLGGKKFLDAGCGDGIHSSFFSSKGAQVVGIDGSPNMVRLAKQNFPDLDFTVADLLNPLPFPNNSFDYVVSILVFMSLERISTFMQEANRMLKSNGQLIFVVHHPCFGNTAMRLYKSWWDKLTNRRPNGLIETYYPGQRVARNGETGATKEIPYYHRTLENYTDEINNAKFLIKRILEPHSLPRAFLQNNPKLEYVERLPRFMVFDCIKL